MPKNRDDRTRLTAVTLADRLRDRLAELDDERVRIAGALDALEPRVPQSRAEQASLVEAIRASPGARGSMLALVCGASVESITAELNTLSEADIVERHGLGWRVRDVAAAGV